MAVEQINAVVNEIRSVKSATSNMMSTFSEIGGVKKVENKVLDNLNKVSGVESPKNAETAPSFATMLKSAIDNVNSLQQNTANLRTAYEKGDPDVDIVEVMIAAQKSSVAFDATMQVRNKLVAAYQEIMRMAI